MSARPGPCGGRSAMIVPTAISQPRGSGGPREAPGSQLVKSLTQLPQLSFGGCGALARRPLRLPDR